MRRGHLRSASGVLAVVLAFGLGACGNDENTGGAVGTWRAGLTGLEKADVILQAIAGRGVTAANAHRAFPRKLVQLRSGRVNGKQEALIDVLIQADPSAVSKLQALGVTVRTVTNDGIITATTPLSRVQAIAALSEVTRIEASRAMKAMNDKSNDLFATPAGTQAGMNNPRSYRGAGVVVGVIDTGIDWTHKDFIKDATECVGCTPETRVAYYWDQSDTADGNPPTGFTYGHEYTRAVINDALQNYDNSWSELTNEFGATAPGYPIRAAARDEDGHGSHVAGSAAGDGSGSGKMGGAPDAELVIVKFDFDGGRNSDASIIDGVNYIFQRAAALGKPAVINMSLGSDYGVRDGTSLEERGIDALTGPGKVVAVAAGNPGANNWSTKLTWGYALHGSGAMNADNITFRFPSYAPSASDYGFFDIWYKSGNKCRVRVTAPNGSVYPPSTAGAYRNTWVTGSAYSGFNTTQGAILVGNGGDQLGSGTTTPDHEVYVEISDYYGTKPAAGTWTIRLEPATSTSTCAGTYHAWYGASDSVTAGWKAEPRTEINKTPRFGGRESDNKMTIGTPASANKVIAVAAYQTRQSWTYAYGAQCTAVSSTEQAYSAGELGYYEVFELGELAYFSGRGPRRDGVLKPEIAAPGVGIASTYSHFVRQHQWPNKCVAMSAGGPYHFGSNRVLPGLEANILQGTSMATPNATGAIAVLLDQKRDLTDACLRKLFLASARHDDATDTVRNSPNSAFTDTDGVVGTTKPVNNDWGYGKLDIGSTSAAMTTNGYATCTGACTTNADCAVGKVCSPSADPCGCSTCVTPVCQAKGTSCTAGSQCCSGSCGGKSGSKTCK
ncbi:MAG: S8 family serine peptidase [Deltaproteobacteria bacterium]|nr:S8 family serine peptidase [Deltaproteobacteria bacterium]